MSVVIPAGYGHVIQPFQHAAMGAPVAITYGVLFDDPAILDAEVVAAADDLYTAAATAGTIRGRLDDQVTIAPTVVYYRQGANSNPLKVAQSTVVPVNGTNNLASAPANLAASITKITPFVGKSFRGRFYWPWVLRQTEVNENGGLAQGAITDLQGRADAFLAAVVAADHVVDMVVLNSSGALTELPPPVVDLSVRTVVGTLRRRLGAR